MARRKSRKSPRRRTTRAVSISGLAESAIMGSAVTKMMFNTNLLEFVTGTIDGKYNPGADGGQNITLPELFGFTKSGWNISNIGGTYGKTYATSFTNAVADNFAKNAPMAIGTLFLTPIAFKFGRKLARKPLREANKLLKGTGVRI
jgi:hypothetical protein